MAGLCLGASALRLMPTAGASGRSETGINLQGQPVDPLQASAGKLVVLVFVRTDCPISNRYAPTLKKLSAEYGGKTAFWLIYPDKHETATAIQKHLRNYGYEMPALRDPQHALVKLGEAQITPAVAVFDVSGRLIYHGRIDNWYVDFGRARSAPTTHELEDAIRAALDGRAPDVASTSAVGCYISDVQ